MKMLNISQISTFFANDSYPIEFLLYFPYRLNLRRFRRALKQTSSIFWPVFGSYQNGIISEKEFIENELFDVETINDIFDPSVDQEELYYQFGSLIDNSIPRLFYVKILHYNNGTVIIPKMKHIVGDGYSYFYFLTVLATMTKYGWIPLAKTIIKRIFRPKFYSQLHSDFLFSGKPSKDNFSYDDLVVTVMKVTQSEIETQKKNISNRTGMKVSTNDLLCAQLLKLILKSKSQKTDNFSLVIPVDMRRSVEALGQRYFGNGLILYRINFNIKEIKQNDAEELALKIRTNFPERNTQTYIKFLQEIEGKLKERTKDILKLFEPKTEFLVTNLTRMPISRLDFGSGPPEIIVPLTRGKSGAAILAQNDKYIIQLGK